MAALIFNGIHFLLSWEMLHVLVSGFHGVISLAAGNLCTDILLKHSWKGNWLLISLFFSGEWYLCLFLFFFSTFSVYSLLLSVRGILFREVLNVRFLNLGSWVLWSLLYRLQFDISNTHLMFRYFLMTPTTTISF